MSFNKLYNIITYFLNDPLYSYKNYLSYTQRVIWAVERSGNYLLKTKCLAQALAVHILLNRKRIINKIQIGFIKGGNKLSAHAWVNAEDIILTGDSPGLQLYFKIPLKGSLAG